MLVEKKRGKKVTNKVSKFVQDPKSAVAEVAQDILGSITSDNDIISVENQPQIVVELPQIVLEKENLEIDNDVCLPQEVDSDTIIVKVTKVAKKRASNDAPPEFSEMPIDKPIIKRQKGNASNPKSTV